MLEAVGWSKPLSSLVDLLAAFLPPIEIGNIK